MPPQQLSCRDTFAARKLEPVPPKPRNDHAVGQKCVSLTSKVAPTACWDRNAPAPHTEDGDDRTIDARRSLRLRHECAHSPVASDDARSPLDQLPPEAKGTPCICYS